MAAPKREGQFRWSHRAIFDLGTKPLVICAASAPDTTLFECVAPPPCLFLPNWSPALRYVVGKIDTAQYLHLHIYIAAAETNLYLSVLFCTAEVVPSKLVTCKLSPRCDIICTVRCSVPHTTHPSIHLYRDGSAWFLPIRASLDSGISIF